jgi:hypothetical protein
VHDQGAVGTAADVELHPVRPEAAGLAKGFHRVFRFAGGSAPMGQHGDHVTFSQVFRNEILAIGHQALYDFRYMR